MERKVTKRVKTVKSGKTQAEKAKAPVTKKGQSSAANGLSIPIYDLQGKVVDNYKMDKTVFDGSVNKGLLYQVVLMYNANKRQGTADTKTRGEVSGGGKKPWRQKGTGRARAGSNRSPLWRGGGVIFGPHPRDYHYDLPKKIKRLAFISSLNAKMNDSTWIGLETVAIDEPKTKKFKAITDALKLTGRSLFVLDNVDNNAKLASRNLQGVAVKSYREFNTMDVLHCNTLVMSKAAIDKLSERIGK